MKQLVRCLLATAVMLIVSLAHGQCSQGSDASCVTSFTISPSAIMGDNSQTAIGTATAHLSSQAHDFGLEIRQAPNYVCVPPAVPKGADGTGQGFAGGCDLPNVSGGATIYVLFYSYNTGVNPVPYTVYADVGYSGDPGKTASLTINPISVSTAPDPDTACPDCNSGAGPINFSNGNTWIGQRDYSIPGLGGGLALTRTWNSLWPSMQPPEQSGIFGDSWRSNFEERIQVLTGAAQYWKGNGSRLFFTYDTFSSTYVLAAPLDDQTTLAFNSGTGLWTVAQKDGTKKTFNNAGYLTSIVDRNGNTTTVVVDAAHQNRISSVTDAGGRTLTFNYTNANFPRLCTSISDAVGTAATYVYDTAGRLWYVQYPDSSQFTFQYLNGTTLISAVLDSQSRIVEAHTYDPQRRGLTAQQANDANGYPINKVTVRYGYPFPYTNNVCGTIGNCSSLFITTIGQRRYLAATAGGAACSTCSYPSFSTQSLLTPAGYKGTYTDANNHATAYTYDTKGNMTSKTLPHGDLFSGLTGYDTWSYTYNSFGEVLTATDPLGLPGDPNHTTTNQYDPKGNLLSTTTPSPDGILPASTTYFTYYATVTPGALKTIQDPLGHITTLTYYPTGLIKTIKDANNKTTTYVYDGRGNRTSIQDPVNGATKLTTFGYDLMNRLTSITYPAATTSVTFHYDNRGRRDWVKDQNNFKTTYAYDDADRLTSVTDAQTPTAGVTRYVYDTESDLTDIYDASNNHTHFVYPDANYLYETDFPSGYFERYAWDGNMNLQSKTDRFGQQTLYRNDYQNRLFQKQYPDYTQVNYTYDAAGRMTQAVDPSGTYTFSYDNMNRLTQADTNYSFDSAGTLTVKYGYDAASNRTSMTDPQNLQTIYTYDVLNRLYTLAFNGQTPPFTFGYDNLSRRTSLSRPNGVNTSYTYDPASSLLSILHKLGTTTLDGATYTYDNAENRKTRLDKRTNVTLTYTYDPLYQLQLAKQGTTTKESYTYDPVGNRLTSLGVSPYQYNSSNQLTSTPSTTYTYDNNGNTKTKADASGTTTYNWDFENRLTSVVLPGSGGTVAFKYDPFGRRVQKSSAGGTTDYLYDGANIIEEGDTAGSMLARYVQSAGVDNPLTVTRGSVTSYYEADGLGSVTSISNSSGALANTYTYDSYGKLTASTGTVANQFQYTGREFDSEIDTYFYRARYYDASVGRFLSEDPLEFGGSSNFYAYVSNDPVNLMDPSGKLAELYCETIPIFTGGPVRSAEKFALDLALGFRAKHCFLRVSCRGKDRFLEIGGTDPEYRSGKYGTPSITPFNSGRTESGATEKVPIHEPSGTHCCEFEKKLEDAFYDQVRNLPPYSPFGPNSNTFVINVINEAGGTASLPFQAWH